MPRPRNSEGPHQGATDALLADFRARFPAFSDYLPLVGGIEQELGCHYPDEPTWRVIAALRRHVNEVPYLKAALRQPERFNLMGEPVGEVTSVERAYVRRKLRQLEDAGDSSLEEMSPLEDMRNGQRLLLNKQVAALFGEEVARQSREYLDRIQAEEVLEELGVVLLSCDFAQDWLEALEAKVPALPSS
jgi:hypothetical protein